MKIRVEEHIRPDGSSPYIVWFDGLDAELGNTLNVKWFADIERAKALHAEYKKRKR